MVLFSFSEPEIAFHKTWTNQEQIRTQQEPTRTDQESTKNPVGKAQSIAGIHSRPWFFLYIRLH